MLNRTKAGRMIYAWWRDTRGAMSVASVLVIGMLFSFMAVPVNLAYLSVKKTQYQGAADLIAYSVLHEAQNLDLTTYQARFRAFQSVTPFIPQDLQDIINVSHIRFGDWDEETQTFSVDMSSRDAVEVKIDLSTANGSGVKALMLGALSTWSMDLEVRSYSAAYRPKCIKAGVIAMGEVKVGRNTLIDKQYCLHGRTGITVASGSEFAEGSSAIVTSERLFTTSGNIPGAQDALEVGRKHVALLGQLDEILEDFENPNEARFTPSYITNETVRDFNKIGRTPKVYNPNYFVAGRIHKRNCSGRALRFEGGLYKDFVLISDNCAFVFKNNVRFENVMIITNNGWDRSFFSFNVMKVGASDGCAPGGGAVLMARGGAYFSAGLRVIGSQIAVGKNVFVETSGGGSRGLKNRVQGGSIFTNGNIALGGDNVLSVCDAETANRLEVDYITLVR